MTHDILFKLAGIGLLSIACQWLAWWVKLPAILFLLLTGIIVGPLTGWLQPDQLFGDLLFPIISLGVAVVLFEGGLTLKLQQIRGLEKVVRRFVTTGVLVSWVLISITTYLILDFGWQLAILFGAVMVVTGPTVIVPMLRTVRPNSKIANVLRWEGIVIDPVGALLAVLVFDWIVSEKSGAAFSNTFFTFVQILAIGILLGIAAGHSLGVVLRRHLLPEYLHNVATLTLVFGFFAISDMIQAESGLLTITVMGMWLANMKDVPTEDILDFKETLSVLMISGLFIILAARFDLNELQHLGWSSLGIFIVVQFVVRPVNALLATWGSKLKWQEKVLLGWIAPRGIVAAAVISLFAIRLQAEGYSQANLLVPLAFVVIIGTVVLQSATAAPLAQWLGVREPEPRGFMIVGANPLARVIGKALAEADVPVLMVDPSWEHIRAARMDGLKTYFGSPVSQHADRALDLIGIGHLLAISPQREVNALACLRYRPEFGAAAMFELAVSTEETASEKKKMPGQLPANIAFGNDVSFSRLSSMLKQGARIHITNLDNDFGFEEYQKKYGKRAVPLFALDTADKLHVFTAAEKLIPGLDWRVLALILPEEKLQA